MNDIAKLNDRFRRQLGMPVFENIVPGKAYLSAGIAALPPEMQICICAQVRNFDRFSEENDPCGEHDFGAFDFPGVGRIFWKIDAYAPDMKSGSEDPADLARTVRVLTVMLASEW